MPHSKPSHNFLNLTQQEFKSKNKSINRGFARYSFNAERRSWTKANWCLYVSQIFCSQIHYLYQYSSEWVTRRIIKTSSAIITSIILTKQRSQIWLFQLFNWLSLAAPSFIIARNRNYELNLSRFSERLNFYLI